VKNDNLSVSAIVGFITLRPRVLCCFAPQEAINSGHFISAVQSTLLLTRFSVNPSVCRSYTLTVTHVTKRLSVFHFLLVLCRTSSNVMLVWMEGICK